MKISIFVDDFRKCPEGWVDCRTVTEAIRMLSNDIFTIEMVSLDHDIFHKSDLNLGEDPRKAFIIEPEGYGSDFVMGCVCPENFTAVAWHIATMPEHRRPKTVYIHTASTPGRKAIHAILKNVLSLEIIDVSPGQTPPIKEPLKP